MKKYILLSFPLGIFLSFIIPIFTTPSALALTTCTYTKLGNPTGEPVYPPECQGGGGNQGAVDLARKQIGDTYVWGAPTRNWANAGEDPSGFDCSGLVGWSWFKASGGKVVMRGQTSADWTDNTGKYQKFLPNQIDQIQLGDLVYFTSPDPGGLHHVGMYSGSGCGDTRCFIDAPTFGKPVRESSLNKRNASSDPMIGFLRPKM